MAITALGDITVHTTGEPPAVGSTAPDFTLTGGDFADVTRTPGPARCSTSSRASRQASARRASAGSTSSRPASTNTDVVCVSNDLPFALAKFCGAEGIEKVTVGSAFRSAFGTDYGITMVDGGWRGLLARAVVVLDADGTVLHTEVVGEDQPGARLRRRGRRTGLRRYSASGGSHTARRMSTDPEGRSGVPSSR